MASKTTGGTPATELLATAGIPFTLHPYAHQDASRDFGAEAARELGVDPSRLFKTLVVEVQTAPPQLVVAVVPVSTQLDLKSLAATLGAKRATMANHTQAERSSGYVVGGISPIGQKTGLLTLVDETAQLWDSILVSAGRRGLQVELAPADLLRATGARYADLAR
ncbi:MAG: Cys-tRNA(Pro) deacylase [Micropruina sp.]